MKAGNMGRRIGYTGIKIPYIPSAWFYLVTNLKMVLRRRCADAMLSGVSPGQSRMTSLLTLAELKASETKGHKKVKTDALCILTKPSV